ncbi:MAG TPA: DegT/DnrJ/EryC1/StrS family aminotransferase [Gemmataceae bacterium]|nr:DegT/DnrJ/EryC1/StrS family aminotransferase [Gemmataceae bacterium]
MNLTFPQFDGDELKLVGECLDSKWVTQGPFTKKFETLFAARHQVKHALATTSCTAALHLATAALELKPGDEVVVPALTWVTSAHAAEYVGAKPVFAEIEADTFNLDPKAFAAAITPRTRAVVVVHLFGLAAKMDELLDIARKNNVAVIEDAACAVGTTYGGKPIGSFGDLGCFSFHPRKVITTGEGGMVTTEDDGLAKKVGSLRNHGSTGPGPLQDPTRPYHMGTFNMLGYNLRLSDIQAAVGVAQIAKLDRLLAERLSLANRYHALLATVGDIARPAVPAKCGHTYQSFVIRVLKGGRDRRNAVMNHMQKAGIQTRPGTHAVHRLGYYSEKYGLKPGDFPISANAEDTTITLPLFPGMTEADLAMVATALKSGLAA